MVVFSGAIYYIWLKTFHEKQLSEMLVLSRQEKFYPVYLLIAAILMPVNWLIEAIKWKSLLSKIEKISLFHALRAVWGGLTINNWIPNRMAEFLGRMIFLKKGNMGKSISCTIVGGYAQFLSNILWGSLFLFFSQFVKLPYWLWGIILASLVLFIFFYFKIRFFHQLLKRLRFLNTFTEVFITIEVQKLCFVFILANLRYFVYLLQFYLSLKAFGINVGFFTGISAVSLIFLIQTFLPAITLTEIGTRGAVILFVFEHFSFSQVNLLASAYAVFLINIIIPTLAGAFFIIKNKKNRL